MSCPTGGLAVQPRIQPELDPDFLPAALWNRAYVEACAASAARDELAIALSRPDGSVFVHETPLLPHSGANRALNEQYVERLVKSLLWVKGGSRLALAGSPPLAAHIQAVYGPDGQRAFDHDMLGPKVFREPLTVTACERNELPAPREAVRPLGRNLDGCRIGFDLGGSDRKSAALIDGEVVFSEEIEWDPYFQKDPAYHYAGIMDTLQRAAAKLPRVEAIGGSAAGVYIDNEPRIASLFRGVSEADFDRHVRGMFHRLRVEWNDVPFEIVNDGEVTALAGSMSLEDNALLGISMGTSVAAGYCTPDGLITPWLNELAFVPVDYRPNAPVDEWSGDRGCGVQYFCQQGVSRLMPAAGISVASDMPLPERLLHVQDLMARDDPRARRIYATLGDCFGYAIASYAAFYELRNLLLLGRTTSGEGGRVIIDHARKVLQAEFPELYERITITTPDEKLKRHGQAIAAASLPRIESPSRGASNP